MVLFSNTISLLEKSLDYSSIKQKVISNNIANKDTPNYKAQDISFQSMLQKELSQPLKATITDERHLPFKSVQPKIQIKQVNTRYNNNGNSVDVDKEMADLAANQIYYNALIERTNGKFQTLQSVIKGGK